MAAPSGPARALAAQTLAAQTLAAQTLAAQRLAPCCAALLAVACTAEPPLRLDLPTPATSGPRIVALERTGRLDARSIPSDAGSASLPTLDGPSDAEIRAHVLELGPGLTDAHLARFGRLDAPIPIGAEARTLPASAPRWTRIVEGPSDSGWVAGTGPTEALSGLSIPLVSPCGLTSARALTEDLPGLTLMTARDADSALLVRLSFSGAAWSIARPSGLEPIPPPLPGQEILGLTASPEGWTFIATGAPGGATLWRAEPGSLMYSVYASLGAGGGLLTLVATGPELVWSMTSGGAIERVSSGAVARLRDPDATGGSRSSLAAWGPPDRPQAAAILPFEPEDRLTPHRVVLIDQTVSTPLVVAAPRATALAYDPVRRGVVVGGEGPEIQDVDSLRTRPMETGGAFDSVMAFIVPATSGPWRGLVYAGSAGLLGSEWAGFGACRERILNTAVRQLVVLRDGLLVVESGRGVVWLSRGP